MAIYKHYQVILSEDDMKAIKAKSGTTTTLDALTTAIQEYLKEPCAAEIAEERRTNK